MLATAGVLLWKTVKTSGEPGRAQLAVPSETQSLANAAVLGSPDTQAVMIVYSDFQCPFCGKFAREIMPVIQAQYVDAGKLRIVFRHLPIPMHNNAQKAAEAASCAGSQGRFWDMHNAIFADQAELEPGQLRARAERLKLDMERFDRCTAGETTEQVDRDFESAKSLGVSSTPSFLFGVVSPDATGVTVKQVISGVAPIAEFSKAIEALLIERG